jgi:hypothetical protein
MSKEEDKELVSRLLKASNEIHKKRLGQANYIHLPAKFIQQQADEYGVTFEEMVKIIEKELKGKKDEQ